MYDLEPWKAPRPAPKPVGPDATPDSTFPSAPEPLPGRIPLRFVVATIEALPCSHEPPCGRTHQVTVYRLPNGDPVTLQVGDVYLEPWSAWAQERDGMHHCPWANCDGRHVHCVVPGKRGVHDWNIDGRASNCTKPDDHEHRCWVRHGDPAMPGELHVDKAGLTCSAGAGSILTDSWHGHLSHGALVTC